MKLHSRMLLAATVSLSAAPFVAAAQVPSPFEVQDSSGVRVVSSAFPDTTQRPVWWISDQPEISVGELEGPDEYLIYRVTEVLRLSDSTLVVANATGTQLRFYDATGGYLRTIGREGEGPREFRSISAVRELEGGRLLVVDNRLKRVTLLTRDGAVVEMHRFEGATVSEALANGLIVGRTGDSWSPREHGAGLAETTTHVVLLDAQSGQTDTLVSLPGPNWWTTESSTGASRVRIIPWSTSTEYATGSNRVAVGWNGSPRVQVYDDGGNLLRIIKWEQTRLRIIPNDIEELVMDRSDDGRPEFRRLLREMPLPDEKPLFRRILIDDERNVWVRQYENRRNGSRRWWIFNRGGVAQGYVDTPPRFRVYSVKGGKILGVAYDDLDVARIHVYSLQNERPEGG